MKHNEKKEKEIFTKIIECLMDQGLVQSKDFIIEEYNHGCCMVRFCPKKNIVLDIQYFYEIIPHIKVFKIEKKYETMRLYIKIRTRK